MSAKETKDRILKCTTELILERGGDIDNVTIRMIAARAGIGVGLTNHYFESKEQLINECIDKVFSELFDMLTGESKESDNAGKTPENLPDFSDAPEEIADLLDFSDEYETDTDQNVTGSTEESDIIGGDDATRKAARAVMDFLMERGHFQSRTGARHAESLKHGLYRETDRCICLCDG